MAMESFAMHAMSQGEGTLFLINLAAEAIKSQENLLKAGRSRMKLSGVRELKTMGHLSLRGARSKTEWETSPLRASN